MKRDSTGKFVSNWKCEAKQRFSVTLTATAWQLLEQEAQKQGISRSEVVEQVARSFAQPTVTDKAGLGLAIVRNLVELHGGTVFADSLGEGRGATFTVRLPLMLTQSPTNQDGRKMEQTLDLNGIKVLVVDDDADSREFVAFVLEQEGANVAMAGSATEALTALNQFQPNILLSDIGMPQIDGYMLLQEVRKLPPEQGGNIPAIALTAYAGEINEKQAIQAGFQKHISKPVEPDDLVTVISQILTQ